MNTDPVESPQPLTARTILVRLVARVLRPLARLMLQHGITLYEFLEIARWVFANAAMDGKHFAVRNRKAWSMTKSRCAVLTGMTRREIDRQINLQEPIIENARQSYHRSVRVLAAWASEADYHDEHGMRGELPLRGKQGSFEQLVRVHCRDISMRSMLDELLYRGCVVQTARNTIRFVHDDLDAMSPFRCDIHKLEQAAEDFMRLLECQLDNQQIGALLRIASPALTREEHARLQARLQFHMERFIGEVHREFAASVRPLNDAQAKRIVATVFCRAD